MTEDFRPFYLQRALERALPRPLLGLLVKRDRMRIQLLHSTALAGAELANGGHFMAAQRFWLQMMADGAKQIVGGAGEPAAQ